MVDMSRGRLLSVDGYRGFVMFLLLASGIGLAMADSFPGSTFWNTVAYQQTHVAWVGCSLHDLIQPGFCFLVGTALTLSIARRLAQGQDARERAMHAFNRALLLVLLGLFIFSLHSMPLIFVDTLAQIGLAYLPAYILAGRSNRILWIAFSVILVVSWMAFVIYPVPDASFDYSKVGVSPDWLSAHGLDGFQAHWQKNSNVAWAFDTWFLNRFPRGWRFESMGSGDTTLNFVPLIATILLGVVAGRILQSEQRPWEKARSLAIGR